MTGTWMRYETWVVHRIALYLLPLFLRIYYQLRLALQMIKSIGNYVMVLCLLHRLRAHSIDYPTHTSWLKSLIGYYPGQF